MALLLENDVTAAETLRSAVPVPTRVVPSVPAATAALREGGGDDLLVVGASVDQELALTLAAEQRALRPTLGVVLLRSRIDATVLREAMRAGVREVVKPDDTVGIAQACERSLQLSRQLRGDAHQPVLEHGAGELVTVFAAKGGVGKTTIATNIAASLAKEKRRTCIVDLDLAFGDVALALRLSPHRTLADAIGLSRLDEAAIQNLVTAHSPNLDVIAAPTEPGTAESVSPALIENLLSVLRTMYDAVVIDTPPAFTEHVLTAFDVTDHFVVAATLDAPAVKNLKLALETLDALGYPRERRHVALNRADAQVGLTVGDVDRTLGVRSVLQIPSSRAVPSCVNRGVPIVLDAPQHPVSQAVRQFCASVLVPRPELAPAPARRLFWSRRVQVAS